MVGLECVCGDVFRAQCDVEPSGCAYAWILLMLSVAMHAWRCCALECDDDSESDERVSFSHSKDLLASISHSVREMAPYVPRAASKSHSQYK